MSRLETSSKSVRDRLITRNSYNPNNIYDINNSTVVDIINTTSNILRPSNGFDFSNTVIGRIVGPNTPIAKIGNQALVNLFAKQVSSTLVRKNIPTVNLNNLFNGNDIISKNIDYSITKESSNNTQEKILNSLRYSTSSSSSINPIISNDQYSLVSKYTGIAQKNKLESLLSQNIYSNNIFGSLNYNNSSAIENIKSDSNIDSIIKSFSNNINLINQDKSNFSNHFNNRYNESTYATVDNNINQQNINSTFGIVPDDFTWGKVTTNTITNSNGILGYTNAIFNTLNVNSNSPFNKTVGQITVNGKTYYNGNYKRNFSSINQYNSISKSIRSNGNNKTNSVIKDSIIPQFIFKNPSGTSSGVTNTVMFSIENLAIEEKNVRTVYGNNEVGPNGGRLMWFMPYIDTLNETVKPNVSPTNFLGRGEPVYTYSNTERSLDLTFLMVVDYVEDFINIRSISDFFNKVYNNSNQLIDTNQNEKITKILNEDLKLKREKELQKQKELITNKPIVFQYDDLPIQYFYETNNISVNLDSQFNIDFENNLNKLLKGINESSNLNPNLEYSIIIRSTVYDLIDNNTDILSFYYDRVKLFESFISTYISYSEYSKLSDKIRFIIINPTDNNLIRLTELDEARSVEALSKRYSEIIAVITSIINESDELTITENISEDILKSLNDERDNNPQSEETINALANELRNYQNDDQNLINTSESKIITKTIQNGFMSYTPYDLYKRLTFLHQCTRQGRTKLKDDKDISNSVFGRPPFIVFKLGDMYNTKAIITQLNISFENDIPWDLNPEGFGVQKMGCKVTLNMNLIGGSSLEGSKSHILNGESRRFYANSSFEGIKDIEE